MNYIFTIVIFLLSTISHGPIPWIVALTILLILLVCKRKYITVSVSEQVILLIMLTLIFLDGLFFVTDILYGPQMEVYYNSLLNNLIVYSICLLSYFCLAVFYRVYHNSIEAALVLVLKIHLALFFIQVVLYHGVGYFIDFVYPFTGELTRAGIYSDNISGYYSLISFRPTGFFVEPSTYSASIITLSWILRLISSKYIKFTNISFFSAILTFSTAGIIISIISIVISNYVLAKNSATKIFSFLLFIVATVSILGTTIDYQLEKMDSTLGYRTNLIFETYELINNKVIPSGFFAVDEEISKKSHAELGQKRELGSLNDSSLFIYIALKFGYLGLVLYLCICFNPLVSRNVKLGLIIVSLTKVSITYPIFWMFIGLAYRNKHND